MAHNLTGWLAAALACAVAACGNSSGPGNGMTFRANDPTGDTFGTGSPQPDVTALIIAHDSGGIDISLDFTASVQSPLTGGPNVVVGIIDLDTDQDSTTGIPTATDAFRHGLGSTGMGDEYYVSLFNYAADSTVQVFDALLGVPVGSVKPTFQGGRISLRVPRALLGGDDGFVNAAVVVGSLSEPTDIVPNNGHLRVGGASAVAAFHAAPRVGGRSGSRPTWGWR